MTSSSQNGTSKTVGDDPQDPILASIRTMEAIREFAADIIPLRPDGANIHEWVGEIDKTLSDLVDREKYLQGTPATPFSKAEDKIARNLIYWTIPRELRSCIHGATSAHDAYTSLQAQFLRNNRTSHMAALVDLFNVHAQISEPHHITTLYDRMYKGINELVASGFVVNEDTLLGALFQIAVGRADSQLYAATSQRLDTLVPSDRSVSSREVAAAARREFEHLRSTVFDDDPIAHPPSEVTESLHVPVDVEFEPINSSNEPNIANVPGSKPAPRQPGEQQHPVNVPSKRQNPPEGSPSHPERGSSSAQADKPVTSQEPASSTTKESANSPASQATQPTSTTGQATQSTNTAAQSQPSKSNDIFPFVNFTNTNAAGKARAISPAPGSRPGSTKPTPTTSTPSLCMLFGATPDTSSPLVTNITPPARSTATTTLFGNPLPATAASNLFGKPPSTTESPATNLFPLRKPSQPDSDKKSPFGSNTPIFSTPNIFFGSANTATTSTTPAVKSPVKDSTKSSK
ncbi:uncharacterized protein PGTG_00451 [Puccinia graminis f. sp. tritici CRL 75-36-700-3]|uniref:Uncharacterized protein n=1 Tax=Puccinia graminis f. sp. tritici (strain CRL 75-36-700-3 / race SCCL) TaxID=418459 RepID=E3JQL9_PUCGT|nr:uncharacterized protein PGTG_00451 [Puccinia graminis f. sp. tritici CRL 75-36-700-3]EFP74495.2 hypothetical protein PGTG_00451 [Puccinia graminis f. sp. tritici CRL 75-36-700-3]